MDKLKIGVVTITYNSSSVLQDFLNSYSNQTSKNTQLYVVDNNSVDNSSEIIQDYASSHPNCSLIQNSSNLGVAEANNQGIQRAFADGCNFILLINNDTVFPPGLIDDLVRGMLKHNAEVAFPKMLYFEPSNRIWCAGGTFLKHRGWTPLHYGIGQLDSEDFSKEIQVEYSPTCCALIAKGVFDRIGLFDEKYFVYYDDSDFFFRAFQAGVRVYYIGTTLIYHKVSSLTGGGDTSDFAIRFLTRNRVIFLRKFIANRFRLAVWLLHLQAQLLRSFVLKRISVRKLQLAQKSFAEGVKIKLSN